MIRAGRRPPRSRLLALGSCAVLACACSGDEAPRPRSQREDPRIQELLAPCTRDARYDRDTSDVLAILVEKLASGVPEVLRRAKEELGAMGEPAIPALRRFVERHYADSMAAPLLENALEAASMSLADGARELLLLGLDHPHETVRGRALVGLLVRHARPEDFDTLAARLDTPEPFALKRNLAKAMFQADRARAERTWLDWIAAGRHPGLWQDVAEPLARSASREVQERAAQLFAGAPLAVRPWLAALALGVDSAEALAFLQAECAARDPNRRAVAARAMGVAGAFEELAAFSLVDPEPQVRVLAVDALGRKEHLDPATRSRLTDASSDGAPEVRGLALTHLVRHRDPAAIDQALAQLGGPPEGMLAALAALRPVMHGDPELAERVAGILRARDARDAHRPMRERLATLKGIGLVPHADAARYLRDVALAAAPEPVDGLRPHRWAMIQAANTGDAGRAYLADALEGEDDPSRRIDLIDAIGADRGDAAREALLAIAEERARSPYEVLFAADRLCTIGPTKRVAPRLKRVAYGVEADDVRVALQCLLWRWF